MREEKLNTAFMEACAKVLMNSKNYLKNYYLKYSEQLANSLIQTLEKKCQQIKLLQQRGEKGKLAYLQLSFLMSGQFSNEHLLKVDFYDNRLYADPYEIECFWDYGHLFPEEEKQLEEIHVAVKKKVQRVMDYEIEERLLTYRLGQMQLLQPMLKELLKKENVYSGDFEHSGSFGWCHKLFTSLSVETEEEISVLYGSYMGSFQKLCTLKRPAVCGEVDITVKSEE